MKSCPRHDNLFLQLQSAQRRRRRPVSSTSPMARRRIYPILSVFHPNLPPATKYILRIHIMHEATCCILKRIVHVHSNGKCGVWPGITFDISSDEGNAILGTVHGAGVAWMLIQRKTGFSRKRIVRITVFRVDCEGDEYAWPSLLFCIG
jgi:hypothetical protein